MPITQIIATADTAAPLIELAAKSAFCLELANEAMSVDTIIFTKDANRIMAPASITKLLTAIVAIRLFERLELPKGFRLVATEEDDIVGSGRNLLPGDRLSLGDCIANLLIPSSNVTANMIARTFGQLLHGSDVDQPSEAIAHFVAEMNNIAAKLGMTRSRFMNPHGLGALGQRSTANDLALLVKECLSYSQITRVWACTAFAIGITGPTPRRVVVKSAYHSATQRAVSIFSPTGFLGGKTGSLWPSQFNLAAVSAGKENKTCISIILGSPTVADRYFDHQKLIELSNRSLSR